MITLCTGALAEIAVVGAHCDDIAIGMGGTLLTLAENRPGLRVRGLVLSGGGTEREVEERGRAGARSVPVPTSRSRSSTYRTGVHRRTGNESRISSSDFRRSCNPDVVFGPATR